MGNPYGAAAPSRAEGAAGAAQASCTGRARPGQGGWHREGKKWRAQIQRGGKNEHLGLFATEAEAKARCDARRLELRAGPDTGASPDAIDREKSA
jgi:hypothetical protein